MTGRFCILINSLYSEIHWTQQNSYWKSMYEIMVQGQYNSLFFVLFKMVKFYSSWIEIQMKTSCKINSLSWFILWEMRMSMDSLIYFVSESTYNFSPCKNLCEFCLNEHLVVTYSYIQLILLAFIALKLY